MSEHPDDREDTDTAEEVKPEDLPGEPGAEGGSGGSNKAKVPFAPAEDDDSALGDTDQHSDAPA